MVISMCNVEQQETHITHNMPKATVRKHLLMHIFINGQPTLIRNKVRGAVAGPWGAYRRSFFIDILL